MNTDMDDGRTTGREMLEEGARRLGVDLSPEASSCLGRYLEELLRWSKKMNLVGKKQDLSQLVEKHFLDSLLLLPALEEADSLVDVGTGAGFPGLVCKTARPELPVHLVEPRLKRVSFLRHVIRTLSLQGVDVHACRAEELAGATLRATHFTSRAVAEISDLLVLVSPLAARGATLLCMKGPRWAEELDSAGEALRQTGFEYVHVNEFTLPFSGVRRAVLFFSRSGSQ